MALDNHKWCSFLVSQPEIHFSSSIPVHLRIKTPKQMGEALPRATGKKLKDLRLVDIPVRFEVKSRECARERRSTRIGALLERAQQGDFMKSLSLEAHLLMILSSGSHRDTIVTGLRDDRMVWGC